MDKLAALNILLEVSRSGGFSTAATRLGLATSSVARAMDALEASLGSVLLTRSRRQVTLTDAGRLYVEQIMPVLEGLRLADESVADTGDAPSGVLRISVPTTFSRVVLAPALVAYLAAYPDILLDIVVTDLYTDLTADRIDVAVRIGPLAPLQQTSLVVHPLCAHDYIVVAHSEFLARHGRPETPAALAAYECFCLPVGAAHAASSLNSQRWHFRPASLRAGRERSHVDVAGHLFANSLEIVFEAVSAAKGIALLPAWMVRPALKSGGLRPLLTRWCVDPHPASTAVCAVHLANRRHSARVNSFIAFLQAHMHALQSTAQP